MLSVTEVHLRTIQHSCYDKNCDIFQQRVSAVTCKLQFGTTFFAIIPVERIQFLPYYFKCLFQNLTLNTVWENKFWWLSLPLCNTGCLKETLHVILFLWKTLCIWLLWESLLHFKEWSFIKIKEKVIPNVKLNLLSTRLNKFFWSETTQKPHGLKPPEPGMMVTRWRRPGRLQGWQAGTFLLRTQQPQDTPEHKEIKLSDPTRNYYTKQLVRSTLSRA